jgi:hypothetical protein
MELDDRIEALKDTLKRVLKFATVLSPEGISVRLINDNRRNDDSKWNGLKTVDDVMRKVNKVDYKSGTPLGTSLYSKVLSPLVMDKARAGKLQKPVMVVILTDGEVCAFPPPALYNWRVEQ